MERTEFLGYPNHSVYMRTGWSSGVKLSDEKVEETEGSYRIYKSSEPNEGQKSLVIRLNTDIVNKIEKKHLAPLRVYKTNK